MMVDVTDDPIQKGAGAHDATTHRTHESDTTQIAELGIDLDRTIGFSRGVEINRTRVNVLAFHGYSATRAVRSVGELPSGGAGAVF